MNTTVLKVNLSDITLQFFEDLKGDLGKDAEVEIRVQESKHGKGLFSEEEFWAVIDLLDWSEQARPAIVAPAIKALSLMHLPGIYLFQDLLSEKLYRLDTRQHAAAYRSKQADDSFSADDFLYVRCAVIAKGKAYYENVLKTPSEMPGDIDFEHLLDLAAEAYLLKTGKEFDYSPLFPYETRSNTEGWKA
jgi:hypothetical protein